MAEEHWSEDNVERQIEDALAVLIGQPLRYAHRAANMATFGFGDERAVPDRRRGGTRLVATFGLHVQCRCRFVGPDGIIIGSRDMYFSAGADPFLHRGDDDWEWDKPGANHYDERLAALLDAHAQTPLMVQAVEADGFGGFRLRFGGDVAFEAFIDDTLPWENWRLFRPGEEGAHFVVTGNGIGDEDD